MRIAILGTTGMLGSNLLKYFSSIKQKEITSFSRDVDKAKRIVTNHQNIKFQNIDELFQVDPEEFNFVINCIGKIKPFIKNENYNENQEAIKININFPYKLASHFSLDGTPVIQIATDCVFQGKGPYNEKAKHDPTDVYGKTKSLGEINCQNFYNLRCSIIGKEFENQYSLLEWFLSQKDGSTISGYSNHTWNGITCLEFAKICQKIMNQNLNLPNLVHIIPNDTVSKYGLLQLFKKYYKKNININVSGTEEPVNRTLSTIYPETNKQLWAGEIKTIEQMVAEMAEFK